MCNIMTTSTDLAKFPMVEALVMDLRSDQITTTDRALKDIKEVFDREGPYEYAKRFGLLVNGSGEEFAIQFMTFWNAHTGSATY
jgi:hypothetical protein